MELTPNYGHIQIAVVGLGSVGLPLALLASRKGYEVIGIDVNQDKLAKIKKKTIPGYSWAGEALRRSRFRATDDFREIMETSFVFICVPARKREDDYSELDSLKEATQNIGSFIVSGQTVILESPVSPETAEKIILPILEEASGLSAGKDFYLAYCPKAAGEDPDELENTPRVLVSIEENGLSRALEFYRSILNAPIRTVNSLKEAAEVERSGLMAG